MTDYKKVCSKSQYAEEFTAQSIESLRTEYAGQSQQEILKSLYNIWPDATDNEYLAVCIFESIK